MTNNEKRKHRSNYLTLLEAKNKQFADKKIENEDIVLFSLYLHNYGVFTNKTFEEYYGLFLDNQSNELHKLGKFIDDDAGQREIKDMMSSILEHIKKNLKNSIDILYVDVDFGIALTQVIKKANGEEYDGEPWFVWDFLNDDTY